MENIFEFNIFNIQQPIEFKLCGYRYIFKKNNPFFSVRWLCWWKQRRAKNTKWRSHCCSQLKQYWKKKYIEQITVTYFVSVGMATCRKWNLNNILLIIYTRENCVQFENIYHISRLSQTQWEKAMTKAKAKWIYASCFDGIAYLVCFAQMMLVIYL